MDKKSFQIGWYNVPEDKEYTNRGFECAAWQETILVKKGKYPVTASEFEYNEREHKFTNELENKTIYIKLNGIVTSDDFCGRYFGKLISNDFNKNIGKESQMFLHPYGHEVAKDILSNTSSIELFPEYEAREINFVYNNEPRKTYGIFKKVEITV
jgi:hypothetical protein